MVNFRKKSRNIKSKKTNSQKTNSRKTIKHGGMNIGGIGKDSSRIENERNAQAITETYTPTKSNKDEEIKLKKELISHIENDIEKVCEAKRERKLKLEAELAELEKQAAEAAGTSAPAVPPSEQESEDKLLKEILEKIKAADPTSFDQKKNEFKINFSDDERVEYSELFEEATGDLKSKLNQKFKDAIDNMLLASSKELQTIKADVTNNELIITMKDKEQTSSSSSDVKAPPAAPPAAPEAAAPTKPTFSVGEKIKAKIDGQGEYILGEIRAINEDGTYVIKYDNTQQMEAEANEKNIKKIAKKAPTVAAAEAVEESTMSDDEKLTTLLTNKTYQQITDIFMFIFITYKTTEIGDFPKSLFEILDNKKDNTVVTQDQINQILELINNSINIKSNLLSEINNKEYNEKTFMKVAAAAAAKADKKREQRNKLKAAAAKAALAKKIAAAAKTAATGVKPQSREHLKTFLQENTYKSLKEQVDTIKNDAFKRGNYGLEGQADNYYKKLLEVKMEDENVHEDDIDEYIENYPLVNTKLIENQQSLQKVLGGKRRRTRWRPRKKKSNKTYRKKPKKIRQKKNKTQRKRRRH